VAAISSPRTTASAGPRSIADSHCQESEQQGIDGRHVKMSTRTQTCINMYDECSAPADTDFEEPMIRMRRFIRMGWSNRWKLLLQVILGLVALIVFALVLRGTLFAPTSIGSPTSESDALIRSNERLLEMAKWTISTILLLGGALIGLNWYSNEHRYSRDRDEQDRRIRGINRESKELAAINLEMYSNVLKQMLDTRMEIINIESQIANGLLYSEGRFPEQGYAQKIVELVRRVDVNHNFKKRLVEDFLRFMGSPSTDAAFARFLGSMDLPDVADALEEQGMKEEARRAREVFAKYSEGPSK